MVVVLRADALRKVNREVVDVAVKRSGVLKLRLPPLPSCIDDKLRRWNGAGSSPTLRAEQARHIDSLNTFPVRWSTTTCTRAKAAPLTCMIAAWPTSSGD